MSPEQEPERNDWEKGIEPKKKEDEGEETYHQRWICWAREKINDLNHERKKRIKEDQRTLTYLTQLKSERDQFKKELETNIKATAEQIKAYESVISSRRGTAIFEPGTKLIIRELNVLGTIVYAQIAGAKNVTYKITYWWKGSYRIAYLPPEELLDDTPLRHPTQKEQP